MTGFIISLLMGLAVGVVYGLSGVRSPAPPLVALVGLLGMVLGEQAVALAKTHYFVMGTQPDIASDAGSERVATEKPDPK